MQGLHVIAIGYNGMPDGSGFKDKEMKWNGDRKTKYGMITMN